jgi:hypothetical protein
MVTIRLDLLVWLELKERDHTRQIVWMKMMLTVKEVQGKVAKERATKEREAKEKVVTTLLVRAVKVVREKETKVDA